MKSPNNAKLGDILVAACDFLKRNAPEADQQTVDNISFDGPEDALNTVAGLAVAWQVMRPMLRKQMVEQAAPGVN